MEMSEGHLFVIRRSPRSQYIVVAPHLCSHAVLGTFWELHNRATQRHITYPIGIFTTAYYDRFAQKSLNSSLGCCHGKVRIHSVETGLNVATVSVDGELAEEILITRG
jgi:hypothetical protein